jgi:hypothetical protein
MKTYISAGIGDMVLLDSILTLEEKSTISEIYWACRFGKCLIPLFEDNPEYPNLISQHIINDNIGKKVMEQMQPIAVPFWHFRPDYPSNYEIGLNLFGLKIDEVQAIDATKCFMDTTRGYVGSSFIKNAKPVNMKNYMVLHYPTSTRPRSDIASISNDDWNFIDQFSKEKNIKVIVISDCQIDIPLSNYRHLINPNIIYIVDLIASCNYYAGCDSFCAHLASKVLPKENLFIKSHESDIKNKLLTTTFSRAFLPHSPEDVSQFYKTYIGYS